jgi:hypothetical protein
MSFFTVIQTVGLSSSLASVVSTVIDKDDLAAGSEELTRLGNK